MFCAQSVGHGETRAGRQAVAHTVQSHSDLRTCCSASMPDGQAGCAGQPHPSWNPHKSACPQGRRTGRPRGTPPLRCLPTRHHHAFARLLTRRHPSARPSKQAGAPRLAWMHSQPANVISGTAVTTRAPEPPTCGKSAAAPPDTEGCCAAGATLAFMDACVGGTGPGGRGRRQARPLGARRSRPPKGGRGTHVKPGGPVSGPHPKPRAPPCCGLLLHSGVPCGHGSQARRDGAGQSPCLHGPRTWSWAPKMSSLQPRQRGSTRGVRGRAKSLPGRPLRLRSLPPLPQSRAGPGRPRRVRRAALTCSRDRGSAGFGHGQRSALVCCRGRGGQRGCGLAVPHS